MYSQLFTLLKTGFLSLLSVHHSSGNTLEAFPFSSDQLHWNIITHAPVHAYIGPESLIHCACIANMALTHIYIVHVHVAKDETCTMQTDDVFPSGLVCNKASYLYCMRTSRCVPYEHPPLHIPVYVCF